MLFSEGGHGYVDRDMFYDEWSKRNRPEREHDGRPPLPLSYTRRVEGMLSPEDMNRLHMQGALARRCSIDSRVK